jgi:phosphodiesterase/alkaline phosphatase D-like protein
VSAPITGLEPSTAYHFRISATNTGGTNKGADETFKTLPPAPTVVTEAASSITRSAATLRASVNPNGGEVSECRFEYGTTTAYGKSVPCTPSPGSGEGAVAVSAPVTGLEPSTAYHFRISATNTGGTSKGADRTFRTPKR